MLESRKFILTVWIELFSCIALVSGLIDGKQWVDMQPWLLGMYGAGNVGEHFAKRS